MRSCAALLLLSGLSSNAGCLPGGGIVDANGEHATVTEALDWSDSQAIAIGTSVQVMDHTEHRRPICMTPCEFDFEPGLHILRFSAGPSRFDDIKVQVGSKRKLVRVALGQLVLSKAPSTTGMVLQSLGVTAVLVGASLWAASSLADNEHQQGYKSSGIALTVGGSAGLLAGIGLAYTKPGTHQPSTVTEVTLPVEDPQSNLSQ